MAVPQWDQEANEIAQRDALNKDIAARDAANAKAAMAPGRPAPAPAKPVVPAPVAAPVSAVPLKPARKITMIPDAIADAVGRTIRLSAICKDANGKVIPGAAVFTSTDPHIAAVKPNGDVTTVNRGSATIIANIGGTMGAAHVVVS